MKIEILMTPTYLNFFIEPYLEATAFNISLEAIAAIFGILSVYLAKKENILVFPTGIISTVIYVYLLTQWSLYGDLIINIYYTLMSIYGWYMWSIVIDGKDQHLPIEYSSTKDWIKASGIFVFTFGFVIAVYRYYNVMPNHLGVLESIKFAFGKLTAGNLKDFRAATPYLDTFTTGIFFAAMWLMANKKIENWILWIAGNIVSIPLYFVKGFGFTGIQYSIFLVLAIYGYIEWKKRVKCEISL